MADMLSRLVYTVDADVAKLTIVEEVMLRRDKGKPQVRSLPARGIPREKIKRAISPRHEPRRIVFSEANPISNETGEEKQEAPPQKEKGGDRERSHYQLEIKKNRKSKKRKNPGSRKRKKDHHL
jgi:hypothetical protein